MKIEKEIYRRMVQFCHSCRWHFLTPKDPRYSEHCSDCWPKTEEERESRVMKRFGQDVSDSQNGGKCENNPGEKT